MSDRAEERRRIERILAGHQDEYAVLVENHQDRVYGLCLSLLKNPTEAEDAAQEIFLKVYQRLREFRFESSFSTWLYRAAYRHSLDLLKSRSRRRSESLDALMEQGHPSMDPPAPSGDRLDLAREVLSELRPEDRLVIALREIQGLTYDEMAETLDISLDALKSRLRRARETLRQVARHFCPTPIVQMDGDPQ
jgi:RNA polymerase sigma-70 factor (ECF subfamily)